ncbi:unnamed protein product [Adineta steineri]|uniref:Uncharacterized protein n=1 Tax=Adineta steineri TaxID=433720 RepID=A0A815CBV0_9BILA|nr:unnamed protein product [Adineta steineri]CAF1207850.1 unnamed protein product [Adineta steineri]CAF1281970.1 unnamed protein product [Adineta steineri]CAF3785923.1 unnamed protein product [Adineta steineri]CAF4014455.1 unnamed protein product [Adineta steineri]
MTASLDLLKTTAETFDHALEAEYEEYLQELKQSQSINEHHITSLKLMWIQFDEKTANNVEDYDKKNHMIVEIEANVIKKHVQLYFQPNILPPNLGCLDEFSPDPVTSDIAHSKEPTRDAAQSSALSVSVLRGFIKI